MNSRPGRAGARGMARGRHHRRVANVSYRSWRRVPHMSVCINPKCILEKIIILEEAVKKTLRPSNTTLSVQYSGRQGIEVCPPKSHASRKRNEENPLAPPCNIPNPASQWDTHSGAHEKILLNAWLAPPAQGDRITVRTDGYVTREPFRIAKGQENLGDEPRIPRRWD